MPLPPVGARTHSEGRQSLRAGIRAALSCLAVGRVQGRGAVERSFQGGKS